MLVAGEVCPVSRRYFLKHAPIPERREPEMSNSSSQLIISLSPDMLSVARTRKKKIVQAEQLALDPGEWSELWDEGLIKLDQPLRQLMSRFSSKKSLPATLIYHSPTVTQQVHKFDLNPSAAREAGVAKIREAIGFEDPVEVCVFAQGGKGSESATTLVYSEREEQLMALYGWLNRCNVQVKSLVPSSVAVMNTAAKIAQDAEPKTAIFYLGADVSVMAYANESGVKLIRSVAIGYQKLADCYVRMLRSSEATQASKQDSDSSASVEDVSARAIEMLFEHGVPVGQAEVDGVELQSAVMPMLAPVLQRFCIEIKQTFRFGLSGESMPEKLMICGPGSGIPHISKVIAQHIDMHIKLDPLVESFSVVSAFGKGTLENTIVVANSCPDGLLPDVAHDANMHQFLSRGLTVGALMAIIALGGEFTKTSVRCEQIDYLMGKAERRLNVVNEFYEQRSKAFELSTVISDMSSLILDNVQSVPKWYELLADISVIKPESVRLHELRGSLKNGASIVEISGLAAGDSDKQSSADLNSFVSALEKDEYVERVTLGGTTRVSVGEDQWARQFRLNVELKETSLPYQRIVDATGGENMWGTP